MKKLLLTITLLACMTFAACGKKEAEVVKETESGVPVVDATVEKAGIEAFVTVGEYKGIELEKYIYTVEDTDVDNQIQAELATVAIPDTNPERVVENGDVINLDYSGSVDGVKFDGGTAENQELEIGSGSFIDGFEDQLIGMHVGESGAIEVTFPEDYHAADLAGVDAVFEVTINSIADYADELTEEWLLANTTCKTEEEYREQVRTTLEAENQTTAENGLYQSAWAEVVKIAEFIQYPQDMVDACVKEIEKSYENYALMYGMEYDAFLEAMGITEDTIFNEAIASVENMLIAEYVLEKEGITEKNEDYQALEQQILASNGFASKEDAVAAGVSEWNMNVVIKYNFVMEYVVENAVVTEVPAEE